MRITDAPDAFSPFASVNPTFDEDPDTTMPDIDTHSKILLIDDDPAYLEALADNLRDEGYETFCYTESADALDWLLGGGRCGLILLDWYMPDIPGIALLKRIRDNGIDTPVIVLTGVNKEVVEDAALGCGAVDFVDKSRRLSILLKRMRRAVEAPRPEEDPPLEIQQVGALSLFSETCRARWKGHEVGLTIVEYRIVQKLAGRAGIDCSYREIYDVVHGKGFSAGDGEDGYRINVRSLIKRIRQKFRSIDAEFEQIENYPGYGYRWRVQNESGYARWMAGDAAATAPCAPE